MTEKIPTDNPYGVKVGQVWEDCDPRAGNRRIQVMAIEGAHAVCGKLRPEGDLYGSSTRIRLDRFRPTKAGYKLVSK